MNERQFQSLEERVRDLEKQHTETDTRLGNGVKVFDEFRKRITALEPKAPDWLKIALAVLTVGSVLMGVQLWITERLNERPTREHIHETISAHDDAGHPATTREIRSMREEQVRQRVVLDGIRENLEAMQKLLLEESRARGRGRAARPSVNRE